MRAVEEPRTCNGAADTTLAPRVLLVAENGRSGGIGRYCADIASLFGEDACVLCLCPAPCERTAGCWLSRACTERGVPLLAVRMPPRDWPAGMRSVHAVWAALGRPLVHANGRRGNFVATLLRAGKTGFRFVSTVHGVLGLHDKRNAIYRHIDLAACRAADSAIAVSADTRRRLVSAGLPSDRVRYVPNGLARRDMAELLGVARARRPWSGTGDVARIGFLGRLSPEKGVDHFVTVADHLVRRGERAIFTIAGDGPQREWLIVKSEGLVANGSLAILGEIEDAARFLAGMDILLMPSANEGLPYSLMEAMAAGCAVIAYGVGGITEVVSNSSLGRIVRPGDCLGLERASQELVADPAMGRALGIAASKHIQDHFSLEARRQLMERVYDSALGRSK